MPTTVIDAIGELQNLSYSQQIEALKEFIEHENTDLQVIIEMWSATTEIIASNVDLLDGIEEQLVITTKAQDLIDVVGTEIEKVENEWNAGA